MQQIHAIAPRSLLDVEIRHLKLMVALAELRSVTRAGEALHLTQSALSHQLGDLEGRLNARLFSRSRTGLVPTAAGQQLLQVAHDVLGRLHEAQRSFDSGAPTPGNLRITTECYTCYKWLPQVVRRMAAQFPALEISIDVNATPRPLAALAENHVDVALMFSRVNRAAFIARPLFEDEWVAVMSRRHSLAGREFVRPEDLADESVILYTAPRRGMMVFRQFFNPSRISPRKVMQLQLTEAMIELAKANLGVAILTRWSVADELRDGSLAALSLHPGGLRRTWSAVYRKEKGSPAYLQEFVRMLKAAFPSGPALQARGTSLGA